jgi:hypothetical protein
MPPRNEKKIELRPVSESAPPERPVVRLRHEGQRTPAQPLRLEVAPEERRDSIRLTIPNNESFETRTHQPGIEAIMDADSIDLNPLEKHWGEEAAQDRNIPWGWFFLILLLIGGALVWSLTRVSDGKVQIEQIQTEIDHTLASNAKEEADAVDLIEQIERCSDQFFKARSIDEMIPLVRHPERVRPLMELHYGGQSIPPNPISRRHSLQPITLGNHANFWMETVQLKDAAKRNILVEISDSNEAKIDWETFVCHQAMKWDTYAIERPAGSSMDFRVYLDPDNFFSHEFADSSRWSCFRLTALESDETLFGYLPRQSALDDQVNALLEQNRGQRTSVILRLSIPEGLNSRRGVLIEKLLSVRWIYLEPPES